MKHPIAKLSSVALFSLFLGLGPVWEARSETTAPDAARPGFLDDVGKLFVWKPEKSAPVAKKDPKESPAPSASKGKKSGEKKGDAGEGDADPGDKTLGSWLAGLGKKEPGENKGDPAATGKIKPAAVAAGTSAATGEKKNKASTADAAPPEPKTPFRWFDALGKKQGEKEMADASAEKPAPPAKPVSAKPAATAKPVADAVAIAAPAAKEPFRWFAGLGKKGEESSAKPEKEAKMADPPSDKLAPVAQSAPPAKPVAAATPAPAVSDDKKDSKPAAVGTAEKTEKKSFELFNRRNREEPNLPEIYEGLSGDEAFDLAMKRAKAKLGVQKSLPGQGGTSGALPAAPIEMPVSEP